MAWRWGWSKRQMETERAARAARGSVVASETPVQWTPGLDPMRRVVDALPIAACLRDMMGGLYHANSEFQHLTGIQATPSRDYAWLAAAQVESARAADNKVLHGGSVPGCAATWKGV